MAKIKIKDLAKDRKLSEEEMQTVVGGRIYITTLHRKDLLSLCARNEGEKIKSFFQGWQENANQVDQQLTSILRIFKDLGRVGVGGSDLGAS